MTKKGSNLSSGDGHNDRHMRQPDSAVREHHVTEMELGHIQGSVENLPDSVPVRKSANDTLARLHERKLKLHTKVLGDMRRKIELIDDRIQFRVNSWCLQLQTERKTYFDQIRKDRIANSREDFLSGTTPAGIDQKWTEFKLKMNTALAYFESMEGQFQQLEVERSSQMRKVYEKTLAELYEIAFQQESTNLSLIESEIMALNQSILTNRRDVFKLKDSIIAEIVTNGIEVEKDFVTNRKTWKEIQIQVLVNNYEELLSSNEILSPPAVHEISDAIKKEQAPILARRRALFDHIQKLAAPSATKQATYDWFQKIRAVQAELEALYKHFLARIHSAYSVTEEHMKSKFSKLFDQLDHLGATDESIADYDERFSEVIGSRVRSYHDTLKYYEMLIGDFNERAQKQLFKFKTFLIGLATLYDHHCASYEYRSNQWHQEFKIMLQESANIENALEDELSRIIEQINMQNQDKSINNLVKKAKVVIEKLAEFEEKETVKNTRYIKHWPKLVEYEMSVYKRYLAKFCQNETKEWKIGEMWSFEIDSKHNCDFMDESQNNAMRAFTTLMESRATRRGNQVTVKEKNKSDLKPRDVMRIIVKNYYRKRRPQQMIAWWWRETQQKGYNSAPAEGGPALIPHPNDEQKKPEEPKEEEPKDTVKDLDTSSNPVYEVIAGSAERTSQIKLGIPAASKFSAMLLNKNKTKMFSKKRFANLIRRNSVQLKVGKGGIDSLIFHLGDRIANNDHVPVFMRDGSIMDSDLADYIDKIITTFNTHAMETRIDECTKADEFFKQQMDNVAETSKTKKAKGEGRSAGIDEIGERRKEVLQFHRTNFTEHQEEMTNCFNELKDRKDEVLEEQDCIMEQMEETIENILPKMTNATNSKQLVEINKEAQAQFDSYKATMKSTVAEYSKWSYEKGDQIRKSNRTCLKGMKGKMIEATIIKDPLRKIETAVKKTIFMCNKELEYSLPERLRTIEMARVTFNDHRLAPHRTDLMYLEAMQRTFTSAQIQLSSETSAISRRLNKLEEEIHQFAVEVSEFVKRTEDDRFPNLRLLIELKRKKLEVNKKLCDLVNHFNCTKTMYQDPKREFYALWLSGRCYSMNDDNDDDEMPASLMPGASQMGHRKSNARLTRPMRSIANALGAVMRNRPSKVSISFGMHLNGGNNDEKRKSSRIGNLGMTRRKMLDPKMELKQAIFGDPKPPTKEDFPCRLTRFLFQTTDKILAISEQYYKKRGNRPITRPYQIRENFERACDFTMFKIIDFERQAKDFVQKQFMEIRKMVKEFEQTCHQIIFLIYQEENREQRMQMPVQIFPVCVYPHETHYVDLPQVLMVMRRYERLFEALEKANQEHYDQIRTSLGHPECQDELAMLEKKERERQFKTTKAINERDKELRAAITTLSTNQVNAICKLAEKYLTEDDERVSVADLLEVEFNSMEECTIRIKPFFNRTTTWNDFDLGQLPDYQYQAPQTRKNGTIQKEIMKQRDHSIRMIEERYLSNLKQFDELKLSSYKDLEFSKKCWDNSIKEIKLLYSTH